MPERLKKIEFLEMIRSARRELDSILSRFSREEMEKRVDDKQWTVKDLISHIDWYETEMVKVLSQHTLEGSDWWNLSLEERNSAIYLVNRNTKLEIVTEKEEQTYQIMLELLDNISEADLNDPEAFKGMPQDWQPWSVIASNTCEHYLDHIEQLKEMLR